MVDNFLGLQLVSPGSNISPFLRGYFLATLVATCLYRIRIGIRPLTTNFLRCIEITPSSRTVALHRKLIKIILYVSEIVEPTRIVFELRVESFFK